MQPWRRLLCINQLACLRLTKFGPPLPVVTFGSIETADENSNYIDVIQPIQSFLATVPHGDTVCTAEEAISSLIALRDAGLELTLTSMIFEKKASFMITLGSPDIF